MISSNLQKHIIELGFDLSYIEGKVKEVLAIAKVKNLAVDPDTSFFVCYDMNGPLTSTSDASLHSIPGVKEAISILKKENIKKFIINMFNGFNLAILGCRPYAGITIRDQSQDTMG